MKWRGYGPSHVISKGLSEEFKFCGEILKIIICKFLSSLQLSPDDPRNRVARERMTDFVDNLLNG